MAEYDYPKVSFETHPDRYVHWNLKVDGRVATLTMKVQEDRPMWDGRYELKLNSYDLSVDIELNDACNRLRWEHPEVACVVVTGGYDKVFCAGANIRMLGMAPHAFKVNFCKYTNETRVGIEDATEVSGQHYVAALNGTASGGGYELALACEKILLIDDGNAAVSLPEVPLLGVLPGTGGLTRLTDKRKIRRDVSDLFCTKAEGFRARDAKRYALIDESFPRSKWDEGVKGYADKLVAATPEKKGGPAMPIPALSRQDTETGWAYSAVTVSIEGRVASILMKGPDTELSRDPQTWAMRAFRELDDALLRLRFNHLDVGLVLLRTEGDASKVLATEAALAEKASSDWWFHELLHFHKRVLRRWDNMAKSLFAIIEPKSCFAGTMLEFALAADRSYMLQDDDGENTIELSAANAGRFLLANGLSRLQSRFLGQDVTELLSTKGPIDAETAEELGLVTMSPDEIDWEDEIRIAVEERVSLSPDALTGMEQNLRFGGQETCETKIYGRLSAWQNWIFQRPNAVGDKGALTLYGNPERPVFDYRRT